MAGDNRGKILILGLGNTILSDDAVGIIVAREVYNTVSKLEGFDNIEAAESSYAGWRLIDLMQGYKKVVIIDAIQGGGGAAGDCYIVESSQGNSFHLQSSHGMDIPTSVELAKKSGMIMPDDISIYAVEVTNPYEFGETVSPEISQKIPGIVKSIIQHEFKGKFHA